MESHLKQRLIGALALLFLGVLIIPLILDGPPPGSPYETKDVEPKPRRPAPPAIPQSAFRAPPPPVHVQSATPPKTPRFTPSEPKVASKPVASGKPISKPKPKAKPKPKPKPKPVSKTKPAKKANTATQSTKGKDKWIVQVASLSKEANAKDLVSKLKKAGYKAFMDTTKRDGKPWHRVRVGPIYDRDKADQARGKIATKFRVKPLVVRSRP